MESELIESLLSISMDTYICVRVCEMGKRVTSEGSRRAPGIK